MNLNDKRYKNALNLVRDLEASGFQARFAGGCVRDRLLKKQPKDYDIATNALPDEVCTLFEQKRLKVILIGIDHGTVGVVVGKQLVEITTLRYDVLTDGRKAIVDFKDATFESDALRRDFTINALFEDKDGKIYDYFNGLRHLRQKKLCFVGDPLQRIREDYLRILRLFRFWGQLQFKPDQEALAYIPECMDGLNRVSQERITTELKLLFEQDYVLEPLKVMKKINLLTQLIPSFDTDADLKITQKLKMIVPQYRFTTRLCSVVEKKQTLHDLKTLSSTLRLSHRDYELLTNLIVLFNQMLKPKSLQVADYLLFAQRLNKKDNLFKTVYLPTWELTITDKTGKKFLATAKKIFKTRQKLLIKPIPITGHDLQKHFNLQPGEQLGKLLHALSREYLNGKWKTKKQGLNLVKQLLISEESY